MVDQGRFIELMGQHLEEEGMPRIAGRLMGALLLSPEPLSLDELAERLGVSKASVSSNARLLETHGIAMKITLPGDRRDYYQISPDAEERSLSRQLQRHQLLLQRLEVGRAAAEQAGDEGVSKRFESLMGFVRRVVEHLEEAIYARKEGNR